jgi:two-component system, NtrC family, response regulator AtoC
MSLLEGWLSQVGSVEVLRSLAELMPKAAVFMVDRDRTVTLWSKGAERLLGFSQAEMLGQSCRKGNRCDRCLSGCGIAEKGEIHGVELTLFGADGKGVRVQKYAKAFFDDQQRFLGGVEILVPLPLLQVEKTESLLFHGMYSVDPAMHQLFAIIKNIAETDATVLIRGESGSGKELVARAIHRESKRQKGPFLAINCAALSPTLLESELFGHKKGAFTGAHLDHPGVFQQANGGTLFLDEVAEIPLVVQAKLLRVLQEKTFTPVGGTRSLSVDVRVVSATHKSLREEVRAGRLREDLMYRLRVVPLFLPPLRERPGDVELLLRLFISRHNERGPRQIKEIEPGVLQTLLRYSWPGNIRELGNIIEYLFAVGRGAILLQSELPSELTQTSSETLPKDTLASKPDATEIEQLKEALRLEHGHVGKAAARLGMSRPTFWRKRKQFNV